jgi:uncharacterized membrane protein
MESKKQSIKINKLAFSAMIIALYIVVLFYTQSFSFGAYQIRVVNSLYGLVYVYPFLVIPKTIAVFISNMILGGLGILDMVGGSFATLVCVSMIAFIGKKKLNRYLVMIPISIIPSVIVPIYLSYLLHIPYFMLVISLFVGQIVPAILGVVLIRVVQKLHISLN